MTAYIDPGYPVDENGNPIQFPTTEGPGQQKSVVTIDAFGNRTVYEFIKWQNDAIEWLDDPSPVAYNVVEGGKQ